MHEGFLIRKATVADLEGIFYLYANYMFDSYFIKFGESFVKRYLQIIIKSSDCITLVAEGSGMSGFIMATLDSKKLLFRMLLSIKMVSLWAKQILRHPHLVLESLGFLFYPSGTRIKDISAELLFIAILPDYRQKGLAGNLIAQALIFMKQKNVLRVKVSTLAGNEAVNALLHKEGFKFEREFRLLKKHIYLYSFDLN